MGELDMRNLRLRSIVQHIELLHFALLQVALFFFQFILKLSQCVICVKSFCVKSSNSSRVCYILLRKRSSSAFICSFPPKYG